MDTIHPEVYPPVRKRRKYTYMQLRQMAIISGFILVIALISLLLPLYFLSQGLAGG
jgi:hypothetical protein